MSSWYGCKQEKTLEITSDTALWYRPGTPPKPIRWVLVRDPEGKRAPQAFFSTDTARKPADILALFVRRWQVEVTFAETRAHLGSKPNGNGPTRQSREQRPPCSASTALPHSGPAIC